MRELGRVFTILGAMALAGCGSLPTARLATAMPQSARADGAGRAAVPVASGVLGPSVELAPAVALVPAAVPAEPLATTVVQSIVGDAQQADDAGDGSRRLSVASVDASALSTWKSLITAAKTGQRTLLSGQLPPYPALDAAVLAAAVARGKGHSVPQPCLHDAPGGSRPFEPVTLVVHGARADVEAVLAHRGWIQADPRSTWSYLKMAGSVVTRLWNERSAPVSAMYIDGKSELFAMNKNSDYVLSRDHMRVYPASVDESADGPAWQIAATRDLAASVTIHHPSRAAGSWHPTFQKPSFGHESDRDTDGERDLIMSDLLASGRVADWRVDTGLPPTEPGIHVSPDGTVTFGSHQTDGHVYEVWLSSP